MKCPNVHCDHDFDIDIFGSPYSKSNIVCPKCGNKVEALWDYYLLEDGDEAPFIDELQIVK